METESQKNKRIAKNTLALYLRMFIILLVGLYTSRVILDALGTSDYGIYNIVGSFVLMFSLISGSLSTSVSRFLTFELGKKDNLLSLNHVFSSAVTIHIILALIVLLFAETIGLWFVYNVMVIPTSRFTTAVLVYHLSVFSFIFSILSTPYNAAIISHEKMKVFAYIGICEAMIRLLIAILIQYSLNDRLVLYSALMTLSSIIISFLYIFFSRTNFQECSYKFVYDKGLLLQMSSFAGWSFIGNGSYVLMTQGVNLLMNVFFGVIVNAARGVASIVDNILTQFVNNFTMALNPQITKSYASDEKNYMFSLICKGSKYSFFLLFTIALPIFLETSFILNIWLINIPEYTLLFIRLTILNALATVLSNTLVTGLLATGRIKEYQLTIGVASLLVLPISFILYKLGFPVYISYIVQFIVMIYELGVRVFYLHKLLNFPFLVYIKDVVYKVILVSSLSCLLPFFFHFKMVDGYYKFFVVSILCLLCTITSIYYFGVSKKERTLFLSMIKSRVSL